MPSASRQRTLAGAWHAQTGTHSQVVLLAMCAHLLQRDLQGQGGWSSVHVVRGRTKMEVRATTPTPRTSGRPGSLLTEESTALMTSLKRGSSSESSSCRDVGAAQQGRSVARRRRSEARSRVSTARSGGAHVTCHAHAWTLTDMPRPPASRVHPAPGRVFTRTQLHRRQMLSAARDTAARRPARNPHRPLPSVPIFTSACPAAAPVCAADAPPLRSADKNAGASNARDRTEHNLFLLITQARTTQERRG